jgi:hypothetical protein
VVSLRVELISGFGFGIIYEEYFWGFLDFLALGKFCFGTLILLWLFVCCVVFDNFLWICYWFMVAVRLK